MPTVCRGLTYGHSRGLLGPETPPTGVSASAPAPEREVRQGADDVDEADSRPDRLRRRELVRGTSQHVLQRGGEQPQLKGRGNGDRSAPCRGPGWLARWLAALVAASYPCCPTEKGVNAMTWTKKRYTRLNDIEITNTQQTNNLLGKAAARGMHMCWYWF